LEIYNEEIRDLLSKNPQARLDLKEHPERGVYVKDLMQFVVKGVGEISSVLQVSLLAACQHPVTRQRSAATPSSHTSAAACMCVGFQRLEFVMHLTVAAAADGDDGDDGL
jgi:hypothetical protein